MQTPVLSLRGATKRFGGLVAVNALDFDVHENQVLGLIGPNGSGKSTTLNLISGALKPTSGEILLRDSEITHLPPQQARLMALVAEGETSPAVLAKQTGQPVGTVMSRLSRARAALKEATA